MYVSQILILKDNIQIYNSRKYLNMDEAIERDCDQQVSEREFTVLVAFLMSIVAISIDALLPALDLIRSDLLIANPNHAQLLISSIFVGLAIGQLITGPLSDAWGRKIVLYIGIGIFLVGSVLCFFAGSLEWLIVGRLIQGLGVSGPYVAAVSIVRDKYMGRDMARVMSLVMMIFIMVPAVAPSLGEAVLYIASWRYIFVLYIFYSISIGCWIFLRLEETLAPADRIPFCAKNFKSGFLEVIRHRATLSYMFCMGICFGSFIGYLNSSQQIFQVQFSAGKYFALYFGILALVMGGASLMNSRLVESLGMFFICKRSFLSIILISVIFLIVHFVVDIRLWMFVVYAAVLFFCFGLIFGNLNAMAMEPMGHIAGIASAIIGAVSSVLSMLIGTAIGQLYNNNLIPIVSGFLIFGIIALSLLIYSENYRTRIS